MNNIGAVICELNPFTFGHKYLVESCYKYGITHLIAIMSSNFVQRGEPSIISKQTRTEIALSCGFDLVVEIPSIWSMSTAERYAYSGVSLAHSLGCVDKLIFGSECCDINKLDRISDAVVSYLFRDTIKTYLKGGCTFAKARELSVRDILGENYSNLLRSPNNILAIEYLKALKLLGSNMEPIATERIGDSHDSYNHSGNFACSSYVRHCIISNNDWVKYIPDLCVSAIEQQINKSLAPVDMRHVDRMILYKLLSMKKADFSLLPDISEGIENRIFKFISKACSFEDLTNKIKTKRYTYSRIKRILMSAFLGINENLQSLNIPYIHVMGCNKKGIEILKLSQNISSIPIISRCSDLDKLNRCSNIIFKQQCNIDKIYSLLSPEVNYKQKYNSKFIFKDVTY